MKIFPAVRRVALQGSKEDCISCCPSTNNHFTYVEFSLLRKKGLWVFVSFFVSVLLQPLLFFNTMVAVIFFCWEKILCTQLC